MEQQNSQPNNRHMQMQDDHQPEQPEEQAENHFQESGQQEPGSQAAEERKDRAAGQGGHDVKAVLEAQVEALTAELDKVRDQMLRAVAEAENTRKRLLREREDVRKYAISDFARDLLDFADNFRRALDSIPPDMKQEDERINNVISGIESMEKELLRSFEKNGIRKIEPMDEMFDPNFHEVMFEVPGTGKPAGTIIQLIEPGYVLQDRLLRPARVGVAKDEGQGSGGHNVDTEA